MIEIEEYKGKTNLSEAYQQVGMKFAFCRKDGQTLQMCHELVKCRDFLNDAVRYALSKVESSIYGFNFGKDNPEIHLDRVLILMVMENGDMTPSEFYKVYRKSVKLINYYESLAGIKKTYIRRVRIKNADKKLAVLFCGDSMWLETPVLLSMYTFFIRLGVKEINTRDGETINSSIKSIVDDKVNHNDNDSRYLRSVYGMLSTIIKKKKELFGEGFSNIYTNEKVSISTFHNYGGMLSFCDGIGMYKEQQKLLETMKKVMENE